MLYASSRPHESAGTKVFVDSTGRRKRLLAVSGVVVALLAALYVGVVAVSFAQAADTGLTTKATVSPSASPSRR